jgi:hypothetical protein
MAAGEHEAHPVVLDVLAVPGRVIVGDRFDLLGDVVERDEPRAPADPVDRLEAAGRHEPGARIGGHAVPRPLFERRPEGLVQRLLGEIEIAEKADERGEDAARLRGRRFAVARVAWLSVAGGRRGRGGSDAMVSGRGYSSLEAVMPTPFRVRLPPPGSARIWLRLRKRAADRAYLVGGEPTVQPAEAAPLRLSLLRRIDSPPATRPAPGDVVVLQRRRSGCIASFLRFGCGKEPAPVRAADRAAGKRRAYPAAGGKLYLKILLLDRRR